MRRGLPEYSNRSGSMCGRTSAGHLEESSQQAAPKRCEPHVHLERMMIRLSVAALLAVVLASSLAAQGGSPQSGSTSFGSACERIASLALADTTITAADTVSGPSFTPPGARGNATL